VGKNTRASGSPTIIQDVNTSGGTNPIATALLYSYCAIFHMFPTPRRVKRLSPWRDMNLIMASVCHFFRYGPTPPGTPLIAIATISLVMRILGIICNAIAVLQ
jgi:hypothetical protein